MIIYNFFKYLFMYFKYNRLLNKIYEQENLIHNLSKLFGHEFKKDWIGRIYTVINPYIIDGKFNSEHIFEINDAGADHSVYIEQYIMQKLAVAEQFIYANNLFDLLTYKIIKLDDYDNYLFIMKPLPYDGFVKWSKIMGIFVLILIILLTGIMLCTN